MVFPSSSTRSDLVVPTRRGLYCPRADVYIDPTRRVEQAIITHAHSDHATRGHASYLAHRLTEPFLRLRLGQRISVQSVEYGDPVVINGVSISLHPAGHIIGSAQVRLEYKGEICVVTGDYKLEPDGVSVPFESIRCSTLFTESTFALPVYRWRPQAEVFASINSWWQNNSDRSVASVVLAYSLGKAQRLLANVDHSIGPVFADRAIAECCDLARSSGIPLPSTLLLNGDLDKLQCSLILVPGTRALRNLPVNTSLAFASGWMAIPKRVAAAGVDRGFVLSDHADWDGLNKTVRDSGADRVWVMHGYTSAFSRWLTEAGIDARELPRRDVT